VWIHRSIIFSWLLTCAVREGRRRLAEESRRVDTQIDYFIVASDLRNRGRKTKTCGRKHTHGYTPIISS